MGSKWLAGLFRVRTASLLGTMAGIALAVALLAALGAFLRSSTASMTARAIADVSVDWQILLSPGASPEAITEAATRTGPARVVLPVGYADAAGLSSVTGGTVQTTGAAEVLGMPDVYRDAFPGQMRLLLGDLDGVLIAQQTAANLHATVGDPVTIQRNGAADAQVTIAGVVELPRADSLFHAIGVAPGAAPQAPPDNVLLLPEAQWHAIFDGQAATTPGAVRRELHVRLDHAGLPADPVAASSEAAGRGRHFEAATAGAAVLADNLAARLDAVRQDALYARVLFLFLGAPGAILAALLTVAVARTASDRRRRDQALLRLRGASLGVIMRLAAAETVAVAGGGIVLGLLLAELASRALLGTGSLAGGWPSALAAAVVGLLLAVAAVLGPAWHGARQRTVAQGRQAVAREASAPLWQRAWLDVALLALGAVSYWRSAAGGYQVVVAPEGVAASAVDYTAFLAPMLIWVGTGLLVIRLVELCLRRRPRTVEGLIRPLAGGLSRMVARSFSRDARRLTAGIALTALAFAFGGSTAIFDSTFKAQARVDAELTNGADVRVAGLGDRKASEIANKLATLPGVAAAQPMQHRFAYVGNDLQDLYGVDPLRIGEAAAMADAYFANHDAAGTLADLRVTPDGVLVSQETINDYQLAKVDRINLRLQSSADHQYPSIPFTIVGVVLEFPTAPKDSFLVANAAYVASSTGSAAAEHMLLRAANSPAALAGTVRAALAGETAFEVSALGDAMQAIGSSLTSVDLSDLTRLELGFALVTVAAAAGLILALSFADRRRSLAILTALGAGQAQVGAFVCSETALVLAGGLAIGLPTGALIAQILVKLLTGVFDPPPEALVIPWGYGLAMIVAATAAVSMVAWLSLTASMRRVTEAIRADQ